MKKPTVYEVLTDLKSNSVKNIILDTDAYNEIDDQYAIAYAMLSKDRINLLSINAAPFQNSRAATPGEGMEKSYQEIFRIMKLTDPSADIPVYRGSTAFMDQTKTAIESEAADNIIQTVMEREERVYIVAIGAITNVASAIVKCPEICDRAVVIWLGGNAIHAPHSKEFNMKQDVPASQIVFDSGIPFVQIPCDGVCTEFVTTIPEVDFYLKGKNPLADYLSEITAGYTKNPYGWSKIIWDVTALGAITMPKSEEMVVLPTPILTSDCLYALDSARHPYIYVRRIRRDPLYADLFRKIAEKDL